jgi:hypothetical protein
MKRIYIYGIVICMALLLPAGITCLMQSATSIADPYWNDAARYLAGIAVERDSVLQEKTQEPAYRNHVQFMNNLWSMIQRETIEPILSWREQNIPTAHKGAIAFYPLSGADFINLYSMFPDASHYILVAMEQPGDAATLRDYQSRRLIDGLGPIQRSIYNYGMTNYFQSKVMIREMNNTLLPGTVPILLIFMARLGLTVTKVENVAVEESGALAPISLKTNEGRYARTTGIRINFTGSGDRESRELVYLSMKLMPDSTSPAIPEGRFFSRLRGVKTLIKSAVYILHDKSYESVRNFILQRSNLIVQDDSGIPYGSFDNRWNIRLYGVYRPYLSLKGCRPAMQNDLATSYQNESFPLPFNFGYGILSGPRQSNLMVARKK